MIIADSTAKSIANWGDSFSQGVPDEFGDPEGFALWTGRAWLRMTTWRALTRQWQPLNSAAVNAFKLFSLEHQCRD